MATQTFSLERVNTPTGQMLVVTNDECCLRAVDWEDHEQRMLGLLRRQYGASAFRLREASHQSAARRALLAYFEGDMDAVARQPTATNGTDFQRKVWCALRASLSGSPSDMAPWRPGSAGLQRHAPWDWRMVPTPSPSSFLAIA